MMLVYCLTNTVNGKRYVGMTTRTLEQRLKEHFKAAKSDETSYMIIGNAIKKYGVEAFDVSILQECETFEELVEAEKFWIAEFKSNDMRFGYNMTTGGEGTPGMKHTPERLQKISDAVREQWKDEEIRKKRVDGLTDAAADPIVKEKRSNGLKAAWQEPGAREPWVAAQTVAARDPIRCARISEALLGGHMSDEAVQNMTTAQRRPELRALHSELWMGDNNPTRKETPEMRVTRCGKIAQAHIGMTMSDEHKQIMAASSAELKRKEVLWCENDEVQTVIWQFHSMRKAAAFVDGNASKIGDVCRGVRRHHLGYLWKYADEADRQPYRPYKKRKEE